jgi:hypothetical protein
MWWNSHSHTSLTDIIAHTRASVKQMQASVAPITTPNDFHPAPPPAEGIANAATNAIAAATAATPVPAVLAPSEQAKEAPKIVMAVPEPGL